MLLLGLLALEAYRCQIQQQVNAVQARIDQTRAQAANLRAQSRKLAPTRPLVERVAAGILDPAEPLVQVVAWNLTLPQPAAGPENAEPVGQFTTHSTIVSQQENPVRKAYTVPLLQFRPRR